MKKDKVGITFDEVMSELDKHRVTRTKPGGVVLTPRQIEFIRKCNDHPYPISAQKMCELWERLGWGKLTEPAMNYRIKMAKKL